MAEYSKQALIDNYNEAHTDQQKFNRNIVKRIQELEDKRPSKLDDQLDIKLMKQGEFNANVDKSLEELGDRIQELEDFKHQALIRLDQEIENRTKAFERIEELENELDMTKRYGLDGLRDSLRELQYNIDIKLERIDDILVVHKDQSDTQRKNHANLIKVWDEKVIPLIKGEHGKQE